MLRSVARLGALKKPTALALGVTSSGALASTARCHCQVPCGIFDDPARVAALKEDAATIRKAMAQITDLVSTSAPASALSFNQAARWVMTKEQHAASIITAVSEYMLCQRVKKEVFNSEDEYVQAVVAHHALLQAAMKAKQVVDHVACDALDHAIEDVAKMYTK